MFTAHIGQMIQLQKRSRLQQLLDILIVYFTQASVNEFHNQLQTVGIDFWQFYFSLIGFGKMSTKHGHKKGTGRCQNIAMC